MADEPSATDDQDIDASDELIGDERESHEAKPKRDVPSIIGTVILIAIVVLVLFLLKDCFGGGGVPEGGSGAKSIERVQGLEPVSGSVSLWISRDTSLKNALEGAGVRALDTISLGEGRYIVQVREGTETKAVRALRTQPGVFDAGRVYDTAAPK